MVPANEIDLRSWSMLLLLSMIWGGSYLFVGIAVRELSPLLIVMARVVIAAAVLVPVHLLTLGKLPLDRRSLINFAVMSLVTNVVPFLLIVNGQTLIAAGLASVINATTPLFAILFLTLAGEDRLVARKIAGLTAGVIGVAILKGLSLSGAVSQTTGILFCLGAAASYGLSSVWAKKRLQGVPPLTIATGQLAVSAVTMTALGFAFDSPQLLFEASFKTWAALLALAVLATSLAYIVFFRIIARTGPANVQLVTMLVPVSAILLGYFVLHETLELREFIGAAVIIDGRVFMWLRPGQNAA